MGNSRGRLENGVEEPARSRLREEILALVELSREGPIKNPLSRSDARRVDVNWSRTVVEKSSKIIPVDRQLCLQDCCRLSKRLCGPLLTKRRTEIDAEV